MVAPLVTLGGDQLSGEYGHQWPPPGANSTSPGPQGGLHGVPEVFDPIIMACSGHHDDCFPKRDAGSGGWWRSVSALLWPAPCKLSGRVILTAPPALPSVSSEAGLAGKQEQFRKTFEVSKFGFLPVCSQAEPILKVSHEELPVPKEPHAPGTGRFSPPGALRQPHTWHRGPTTGRTFWGHLPSHPCPCSILSAPPPAPGGCLIWAPPAAFGSSRCHVALSAPWGR